jgi:hypothetical protein
MSWLHAHFSRDLAIHAILGFDPPAGPDAASALRLAHGYVLDRGEVLGLKAGEGESVREDLYPASTRLHLVDCLDREWHLEGAAQTTFPWQAWPGVVGFNVLHEWRCDGRTGLGEAMDFLGMSQITALYNSEAVGT